MTSWWTGLAPVTSRVTCGEQNHELHWSDGVLAAPGHPDGDRERALAALGADPSPCLQIVDAWNRHADDLDVLVIASRGAADPLEETPQRWGAWASGAGPGPFIGFRYGAHRHGVAAYASTLSARPAAIGWAAYSQLSTHGHLVDEDEEVGEVPALLSLGAGLPQRLAATVIGTWSDRLEAGDERIAAATPVLDAAVYGRLRVALLPWLGGPAKIDFALQPTDAAPVLRRDGDTVVAALPFTWLRDVWVNGLAVILDRFCIRAERTVAGSWALTTLSRDLTDPQRLTISG